MNIKQLKKRKHLKNAEKQQPSENHNKPKYQNVS